MNIIKKLDMFIGEEGIVAADVETNTSKGNIDVVGGKCKEGYRYCTRRKVCVPITNENTKVEDIKNIKSEKDAERILKGKGLKWNKKDVSDQGGILYINKGKDIAMWFKQDNILTVY